ncbi:hypothetical protein ALP99_102588 [Pseudomonas syringae pv. tomato]|uniref:Uncharacterized protein n=2 Tax=Pseudomonas syringae group genomosp. 3 TaxID=251701 RepID=A0A0N8QQB8_9PSED|nr:hypothetical protein PSPTOT1_1164 [Pseudomonas syringae pv. tomato T1]KPW31572.1 hypothetical protein ALO87_102509 [Pseudomonas syringae pv. apii]KPW52750.1 hypothetical protein ALO88_102701 [Pseudomonas syringae pv. antirrhini]KPY91749.1 hypothetical protein ALO36_103929 [Pseudomonas syringae pv. tomato]RMM06410.1 hypothetical protein ALQ85_102540 [Pseudomonas syringae]RMM76024.1 hypothetical protein ALQ72_100860 [Pseudomonas syringae pv. maculicola]
MRSSLCTRLDDPGKRSGDFADFDPSKSVAEGRKGDLSLIEIYLTSQNPCVTRSATKRTQSVGTIISQICV